MSTLRKYNFSAGPAMLPLGVLNQIKDDFMNYGGMSIFEISHRSDTFATVIDDTMALIRDNYQVPETHDILLLQGGASHQFAMIPLNLMDTNADYMVTGLWAQNAYKEAACVGNANLIFSSEKDGFSHVPGPNDFTVTHNPSYVHITSNNTIYGTQYHYVPDTGNIPLISDMSSDFMGRPINISDYDMIYAGAQKNAGPAGVTIVIINKQLLKKSYRLQPEILTYEAHARKGSIYNTPPVFAIYVLRFMMQWLKDQGGTPWAYGHNKKKSDLIYDVIDRSSLYTGVAHKSSRSHINISFTFSDNKLCDRFIEKAGKENLVGLNGHRCLGGVRVSMYNAFPYEGAHALAEFMVEFERTI